VTEVRAAEPTKVVNLLDALTASVAAAQGRRQSGDAGPALAPPTSRAPKKSPSRPAAKAPGRPAKKAEAALPDAPRKADLLKEATRLNIAGRSKMSREELVAAVAAASEPTRRRRAS
jgi:hypothetical protein